MSPSHFEDVPGWKQISDRIKKRDNFTCQNCGIREGATTFERTSLSPCYARKENGKYCFYKVTLLKNNLFLAATPENVSGVNLYLCSGTESDVERYPYHFQHCAGNWHCDGFELQARVRAYQRKNRILLKGVNSVELYAISAILDVHHIDGNKNNNEDSNLKTLCFFCHQNVHQVFFD